MTRIMGLDLSLTGAGVAVLDAPETVLRAFEVSSDARDGTDTERADLIALRIAETCIHYLPDVIWIEAYAYSRTTVHRLAEVGGIVKLRLWEWGQFDSAAIQLVSSNTVKKFMTGNGKASKKEMVEAAQPFISHLDMTRKQRRSNNIADAVGIALYGSSKI